MKRFLQMLAVLLIAAILISGCATKQAADQKISNEEAQRAISAINSDIARAQTSLAGIVDINSAQTGIG